MRLWRRVALAFVVLVYAAGIAAEWVAPASYATQFRESASSPPCRAFPLGTDELGRDLLSRLLYGTRVSLTLAPAAALVSTLVAALVGGFAGYLGGFVETIAMRITDLFLSLPWLFLLLMVRALLPLNVAPQKSVLITFLLLGFLGWAGPARVIAAEVKSMATADFVLQARAAGCRKIRLLVFQLLPNLKTILTVQFWVAIPVFIVSEANLGFLGLGVGEPLPSWGSLLRGLENYENVMAHPWLVAPLVLLIAVMSCFQIIFPTKDIST